MTRLTVTVIDKITNNIINVDNILLDDSIKKIKEKLFIYNPEFIPALLKIEVKDKIVKDSNELLLEYFDEYNQESIIYIYILQNELNKLNESEIMELYLNRNEAEYKNDGFIDLTPDDMQFILKFTILQRNIYNEEDIRYEDIEDYILILQEKRNVLVEKYEEYDKDVSIQEFYKLAKDVDVGEYNIIYNDINLNIVGENFESGSKGIFIKLNEIYNILELNESIPFIVLGKRSGESKMPQIKIYNKLINTVNEKEIKSWILNEKKKLNEATYKIIKGLLIKSKFGNNYLTINILPNGLLDVNLKLSEIEQEKYNNLNDIIDDIKKNIDNVIRYINSFNGVFLQSKRISLTENSIITINSIDTSIETDVYINKTKFQQLITQKMISENILELKNIDSLEFLSAFYKKFKTRDHMDDIKGITINIRDNPYREDSSVIKIFGANNYNQTLIIFWTILILNEMSILLKNNGVFDDFISKRKIKEKTNKKRLKEQGINFDSRECQAIRQPILNTENKPPIIEDSYTITFKNQNYQCNSHAYPYPGFTKNNVVCCFKYTQAGNENYIKNVNPESLDILVEPSNFKITIENKKDGSLFETFVIKIVADYQPGFNELNSMPRYYYLTNSKNQLTQDDLEPIYNKELIKDIENEDNIWLDRVSLAQIIYPSATNKCSFKPDLNNRISLNQPCKAYKKEKHEFFGYTAKSIPCCFDKPREEHVSRKKKESDITKQYIIQSPDKILHYQKIGFLPDDISKLFKLFYDSPDLDVFYRMGIVQNNSSFLNVILLAMNNIINKNLINNHLEFKQYIIQYLQANPLIFNELNNGDISVKYTLNKYINYINNDETFLNWNILIDLLEKMLKRNIIVIDVSGDNSKLLCRKDHELNSKYFNRPFIIILKRKDTFELVVQLILNKTKKNDIIREFDYNNKIIKFLTEYYKDTCIKENIYPINYPYIPINNFEFYINNSEFQNNSTIGYIKYQIKNSFNKINFLMTSKGCLIPILENGIIDNSNIQIVSFKNLITQKTLLSLKDYIIFFKIFNKITFQKVNITGLVESETDKIGGIMTNYGVIIPYLKNEQDNMYEYPILDFKYYLDIDEKLQSQNVSPNNFIKYTESNNQLKIDMFNMKKVIGREIFKRPYVKDYFEKLIKNSELTKNEKIYRIIKVFKQIPKLELNITLLKAIANEIINDNKENLILNNIITSDTFNKNDVIIRDSESILLNIDDIRQWIKHHKIIDN